MNLYEISQETQTKINLLGQMLADGKEPTADFVSELLDLRGELDKKLVNYGFVIKQEQAHIDSLQAEIDRLTKLKKSRQGAVDLLKNRMQSAMVDNNLTKIDDPILPIRIQKNPKSVRLDIDPIHLPQEFQKVAITADKTAIKKALESGQEVKGAVLEQGQSIRIG